MGLLMLLIESYGYVISISCVMWGLLIVLIGFELQYRWALILICIPGLILLFIGFGIIIQSTMPVSIGIRIWWSITLDNYGFALVFILWIYVVLHYCFIKFIR